MRRVRPTSLVCGGRAAITTAIAVVITTVIAVVVDADVVTFTDFGDAP